jgi:hypothetical protein
MTRLLLVLGVSAVITGCASYGDVAKLNRTNQQYLEGLSKQLGPNDTSKRIYAALGSSRAASLNALSEASLSNVEAQARFSDPGARKIYLNAQTARLQTEFNDEAADSARRAGILRALDGKFADATKALHENGQDIQRYLDMGFFERLFTDVRGMDTTKLKQIGEDLKSLSQRIAPGMSGAIQGGSKP